MELISFLPGALAAIPTMHYLTHPKKLKNRVPKIRYSAFELSPNIRLNLGSKTIWFHHWINFSILLAVSIPLTNAFLDAGFTKGFLAGGIIQGLMYSDRHKIIFSNKFKKVLRS